MFEGPRVLLPRGRGAGASFFLFLAVLFFGIAHSALLPPFEGLDEIAHFSSLRQIAATRTVPVYSLSKLDAFLVTYRATGPLFYHVVKPYDANNGLTYDAFAARPALFSAYREAYRTPHFLPPFAEADTPNWQAQHPPLYYALMAVLLRAVDGLSLIDQLFLLRLASFALALAGLAFGGLWLRRVTGKPAGLVFLAPFLAPMFFPTFVRLGNDALCLFFVGASLVAFDRWREAPERTARAFLFGLALAGGLMTKAFFLPLTLGFGLALAVYAWPRRVDPAFRRALADAVSMMALPVVLAGFWYVYKWKATGVFSGGADFITLDQQGGLVAALNRVTPHALGVAVLGFWQTVIGWTTASIGLFPLLFHGPLLVLSALLVASYVRSLTVERFTNGRDGLPVFLVLPLLGGFVVHMLTTIALAGASQTPGWYLNILAPFWALAWATAPRRERWLLRGLLLYAVLFLLANLAFEAMLYGGALPQVESKAYDVARGLTAFADPSWRAALNVIAQPVLAAWFAGAGLLALAFAALWRRKTPSVEKAL
jgi:hypothetical protein